MAFSRARCLVRDPRSFFANPSPALADFVVFSVPSVFSANILVRAYDSRLDLMRCLIVGPLGTPFQNAPFLFDLFLSPSKFPQEPPQVFFHSWAGGTRVSPNLYAEGKVCLSLLGTWSGDKTEVRITLISKLVDA